MMRSDVDDVDDKHSDDDGTTRIKDLGSFCLVLVMNENENYNVQKNSRWKSGGWNGWMKIRIRICNNANSSRLVFLTSSPSSKRCHVQCYTSKTRVVVVVFYE